MPSFLKKRKNLIILSALILFQLILISIQVPLEEEENYLEKIFFSVFAPLQHGVVSFFGKIGELWNGYFFLRGLRNENRKLKEEALHLRQENILLKQSLQQFQNADEIQAFYQGIYSNVVYARTIGLDMGNPYKSLNINKGILDGIERDMVILDKFGNLVGRVIGPVSLKQSRVQLITDNKSGVSVSIFEKKATGILEGDGRGTCNLKHILTTNEDIQVGDDIFTTGFDGIYPPGIKVGIILTVQPTSELFQEIKVKPYFAIKDIDQLAVIKIDPKTFFE